MLEDAMTTTKLTRGTDLKLTRGTDWVTFGSLGLFVEMRNSLGEKLLMERDDADWRIEILRRAGWV